MLGRSPLEYMGWEHLIQVSSPILLDTRGMEFNQKFALLTEEVMTGVNKNLAIEGHAKPLNFRGKLLSTVVNF